MPAEGFVFGDQDVAVAVAVEVDEFEVRVAGVEIRERAEGAEGFPLAVVGAFVEAAHGSIQGDDIWPSVTGEVHELRVAGEGEGGLGGDEFDGAEAGFDVCVAICPDGMDGAEVALVEPRAGLLGEDAGETFAVEIDPLVSAAVETDGH